MHFFWHSDSPLSQSYSCRFNSIASNSNITPFTSSYQYMIGEKALIFGDYRIYDQVLSTSDVAKIRDLGRLIGHSPNAREFNEEVWSTWKYRTVLHGNDLKFSQNIELKDYLLDTGTDRLAEASPYDRVWGIGFAESDWQAQDESTWAGTNLLGNILEELRAKYRNELTQINKGETNER